MRPEVAEIIEMLDTVAIHREDLYAFTEDELVYLWQGAHAHAGKRFHQEKYQSFFGAMDWYTGEFSSYAESGSSMRGILLENYTLISQYLPELRRGIAAVVPRTFAFNYYEENMAGEDVLEMQHALLALGYLAEECCTGEYDRDSRNAVSAFQEDNGLEASGIFDAVTRMMLL